VKLHIWHAKTGKQVTATGGSFFTPLLRVAIALAPYGLDIGKYFSKTLRRT
jgi:hypothetical protein